MPARSHSFSDLPPTLADRRLYRRYATGLGAELVIAGEPLACRITDISLGGAAVELIPDTELRADASPAVLRSAEIAAGFPLPVLVMRITADRVNLAFTEDEEAEHELTMFLLDSPATQESALTPA